MLQTSEAIVLRTYPVHESDLLITLFTRTEGKIKGVAKAAMKSRKRFGGALEPMTLVRAHYEQRERRDLVRLDAFEILASPLTAFVDYERVVALSFIAEVLDQVLADNDPHDDIFRLTYAVLAHLRKERASIWLSLTYFSLWITRLTGFLPDFEECVVCGDAFGARSAYFHALADGLMCPEHKRVASNVMPPEARALAAGIFRSPIDGFADEEWPRSRAAELRKLSVQIIERHIERKLVTRAALSGL